MSNNNLIFVGGVMPEELFPEIKACGSNIDYAGNKFQLSLIDGLSELYDTVTVVSAPLITSYPKARILFWKKKTIQYKPNVKIIITGYINLPYVKMLSKCYRIFKNLLSNRMKCDLIIYSPHSPYIVASWPFLGRSVKSCFVLPDLPEFMRKNANPIYKVAKRIDHAIIDYCAKKIDSYILFSPYMKERFNIGNKPYTVVEGIFKEPDDNVTGRKLIKNGEKVILYTGRADERYGIRLLIDAFMGITDPSLELWIRGDGDTIDDVIKLSQTDTRIKHVGMLSSEDLRQLQKDATILINPVNSQEEFTKYFFPSKTMEYLASGTPTVMSRLKCMPKEYDDYIYYYDEDTPETIRNKILEVCRMPLEERKKRGEEARSFIISEKNNFVQSKKIKMFLNKLD